MIRFKRFLNGKLAGRVSLLLLLANLPLLWVSSAHVHIQAGYANGELQLFIYDFEVGNLGADEMDLVLSVSAKSSIPDDDRFTRFLGPSGGPVWIAPQIEREGHLNLGVGTSGISPNVFQNNALQLSLRRVEGPGHFAMYTSDALGSPRVLMASIDGIDPNVDVLALPAVAAHLHMNWAFTAPGLYRIGFSVSGRLRSSNAMIESAVVDYTFLVEDTMPLRLRGLRRDADGRFYFEVEGPNGMRGEAQRSSDLVNWVSFAEFELVGRTVVISSGTDEAASFFRAREHLEASAGDKLPMP